MYGELVILGLIVRFEQHRRQASVERGRELQWERGELPRTIHDTVAQTAYMVGIGLDRARKLAGESNGELSATLDAMAELSKSVIWESRRPLDGSHVCEGTSLRSMLRSLAEMFTTVTSIPAEVIVRGTEPALREEVRTRLFSIAHDTLTNAFRHARAARVEVSWTMERTPSSCPYRMTA